MASLTPISSILRLNSSLRSSLRASSLFHHRNVFPQFVRLKSTTNDKQPTLLNSSSQLSPSKSSPTPLAEPVFTPEERLAAAEARIAGLGPIVGRLPTKWIPYAELMRLEKPVGTWLLLIPCTWSILIAAIQTTAPLLLTVKTLGIFAFGALVMRGFGCTVNDLLDRNLDNQVARTIERPLASKRVSVKQALVFGGAQLGVGLGVLLQLPWDCFYIGAASLLPVCTYPLFKRFTYYPQAVLSFAFNWGAILGFPAMGLVDWSVMLPLFASSFCWTMVYDTIYAHQDKKFDVKAGIKSTALAWGENSKKIFTGLTVTQLGFLGLAGWNAGIIAMPGFIMGSTYFGYKLFEMIKKVNLDDPKNCWSFFLANIKYGFYVTFGLGLDYILSSLGFW
ncbi:hypothetical protein WICPIJ_000210 [Wickerhamomyces pijperi]|uniref:4-hydroxybenzoate polyprenyltransferase, mitochondrial n=1 Tax=Wickerhamomyces pijperi TaxID=599730 RepID=A0A9P8QE80_WICPI|nr:hypothetical protein WICPIJ_000210 [Wickerhamomyces pijperi]